MPLEVSSTVLCNYEYFFKAFFKNLKSFMLPDFDKYMLECNVQIPHNYLSTGIFPRGQNVSSGRPHIYVELLFGPMWS